MEKILIINNEMSIGGTEKVLLTLLKYMDRSKYNITLLLPALGDEWGDKIPPDIKVEYLFRKNPRDFNIFFRKIYELAFSILPGYIIQKFLVKNKYDTYISFKQSMVNYLRGAQGKKICWVHGTYTPDLFKSKNLFKRIWKKYLYRNEKKGFENCDRIICVSDAARVSFINTFDIDKEKVLTRYNPNDVDEIRKKSSENVNLKLNDGIIMCAVGRMDPIKAFDRLINISKMLFNDNLKHNIIMVGDGPEYGKLKELINKNSVSDNIHMIGYEENPYKYINLSDLLVCSSISEAFSTVATEAIILKKPVITTECSGMTELLNQGECGLITKNNEKELYDGIKKVIMDKHLLNRLKSSAEKRSEDFNTLLLIKKIEEVISM